MERRDEFNVKFRTRGFPFSRILLSRKVSWRPARTLRRREVRKCREHLER